MNVLQTRVSKIHNIHILTGIIVEQLLFEDCESSRRCVNGVRYYNTSSPDDKTILQAGSVVVTAGGSAFDQSDSGLLAEFAPQLRGMATSSGPQADGSGIKLARAVLCVQFLPSLLQIGAQLVNMDKIQVHPSGFIDPSAPQSSSKFLAPEALRGSGGLLLDSSGQRFANELGSRSYLAETILRHCTPHPILLDSGKVQPVAFMLLNHQVCPFDLFFLYIQGC